jgi:hypothetical protein
MRNINVSSLGFPVIKDYFWKFHIVFVINSGYKYYLFYSTN